MPKTPTRTPDSDHPEQFYWVRSDGTAIAVEEMNEYHARNALRQMMAAVYEGDNEALLSHVLDPLSNESLAELRGIE